MKEKLKQLWQKIVPLQFWLVLFVETLLIGIAMMYIDYAYETAEFPYLLRTLNFPYFGVFAVVIGAYSLFRICYRLDLFSVLSNAAVWFYITTTAMFNIVGPNHHVGGMTVILAIVSLAVSVRIIINAYMLNLEPRHKKSK